MRKTLTLATLALAMGCGNPDPEPGEDAGGVGPDASLDAAADASHDAGADASADADAAPARDCDGVLPDIVSLTLTPSAPAPGEEVVARVETTCFTYPISRVEVFTRDPRVELAASAEPSAEDGVSLTIVTAAIDALAPGSYEVGVSVTSSAETLTQERLATLEVPE
jgi:hypothetical protein